MSVFRRIPGTTRKTTSSAKHLNSKSNAGASMGLNFSFTPTIESPSIENDYVVGDLIGQGSFMSVWKATCRNSGEEFAMKSLLKHENTQWRKEVALCKRVQEDPHTRTSKVMQIRDVYESREEAFIVSDLCLGGDLLDWMIDDPKESVDEMRSLHMARNMLMAAESVISWTRSS